MRGDRSCPQWLFRLSFPNYSTLRFQTFRRNIELCAEPNVKFWRKSIQYPIQLPGVVGILFWAALGTPWARWRRDHPNVCDFIRCTVSLHIQIFEDCSKPIFICMRHCFRHRTSFRVSGCTTSHLKAKNHGNSVPTELERFRKMQEKSSKCVSKLI